MRHPQDIIIKPIITEGSMENSAFHKYTFQVDKKANKTEIKNAVEMLFNVQVKKVNTMNMTGKVKRMGTNQGRRANWKKAIVTLAEGSKAIELFEGM